MALPLGELSPKVTERALHHGSPSPSSLRSATSPKGRGKGAVHYPTVPVNRLMRPAHLLRVTGLVGKKVNIIYSVTTCNVYIKQVIHIFHSFLHRLGWENG